MNKTHMLFGFLVGLFLIPVLKPANQILFITIVVAAALLPDIDHPNSKVGKKVKLIAFLFEHRGFFHSLFAIALFSAPLFYFNLNIYAYALIAGYGSHLVSDCLSYMGIMPFHPLSRFKIKGFIKTSSWGEKLFFVLVLVIAVYKLVHL